MNKTYKTVYNEHTQTWVAVSEITKTKGKSNQQIASAAIESTQSFVHHALTAVAAAILSLAGASAFAGPSVYFNDGSDNGCAVVNDPTSLTSISDSKCQPTDKDMQTGRTLFYNPNGGTDGATSLTLGGELYVNSGKLGMGSASSGRIMIGSGSTLSGAHGVNAVVIGPNALGRVAGAIAIGDGSSVSGGGNSGLAIGSGAQSTNPGSYGNTALGFQTYAYGDQAVALGSRARAEAAQSMAIGNDTRAITTGSVAIGGDDSGTGGYNTSISGGFKQNSDSSYRQTLSGDFGALAISPHAQALTKGSTALGVGATAGDGIQSGGFSPSATWTPGSAIEATAIGAVASATAAQSTSIGYKANATAQGSVAVGNAATADKEGSVALGGNSKTTTGPGTQGFIPNNRTGTNTSPTSSVWTSTHGAVAVGDDSGGVYDANGILTSGKPAVTRQITGVAAGFKDTDAVNVAQLRASTFNYTSINSSVKGNKQNDGAKGTDSIAIGADASTAASAINGLAIGKDAQALAENAIAIGKGNKVSGKNSGAIGDPNTVSGAGSYAIGNNNTITQDTTFVVGNSVTTTQANSVVLGNASTDRAATAETTATVGGITYSGFTGVGSVANGVVSVGATGKERQLINVAAGRISATSTDAINGSQLYAAQNAIGQLAQSTSNILGGGAAVNTDGSLKAPAYMVKTNAATAVTAATAATNVGEALTRHENRLVTVEDTVSKGIGFTGNSGNVTRLLGGSLGIKGMGNISTEVVGNDVLIKIADAPVFSGSVKANGFDASGGKVTNVAAGDMSSGSTDAVNGGQLFNVKTTAESANTSANEAKITADSALTKATKNETDIGKLDTAVNKGLNFAADSGTKNMKLGDTITVAGDGKNISTSIDDAGKVKITLSDTPSFTTVKTGNVTLSATGINMDSQKLSNLGAGTVSGTSTDGVNGSQLYGVAKNVSDYLGGGAIVNNGTVTAPTYNIGGVSYHSVGDALAASNRQAGTVVFVDDKGARVYRASDGKFYSTLNADGTGNGTVIDENNLHHALRDPSGTVTAAGALSNVGVGKLDTDAANISQLKSAVNALGGGAAVNADGSVTAPSYAVKIDANTPITEANKAHTVGEALTRHENRLVTVEGDVNTLKTSAITFSGNEGSSLPKKLGDSIGIKGSGGNVITKVAGENIEIRLADAPTFTGKVSAVGFDAGNAEITNVADGSANSDAVNVKQLELLRTTVNTNNAFSVNYDKNPDNSVNKNSITLAGSRGTVLKNLADGNVSATSQDAINGKQLFNAKKELTDSGFALQAQDNNTVSKKLGEAVRVVGDGGNISTSVAGGEIKISMSARPTFGTVAINQGGSGKISGLSAGTATSDAVNFAQLKPLADALGSSIDAAGTVGTPNYTVGGSIYNTVGGALGAVGTELSKGLKLSANGDASTTTLPLGGTLDMSSGSNTVVALSGGKYTIGMVNNPTFSGTVTTAGGLNVGGNKITNVGAGTTASDAVNYKQLQDVITSVTNNSATKITLTSPMVYLTKKIDGSNAVVARANDGKFYNVDDVLADGTTKSGATAVATSSVHISAMSGGGSSTTPIIVDNIAAGVADTDAVNKKQLSDAVAIFGNGAQIDSAGNVTQPTYKLMGDTYRTVGEVFNALNHGLTGTVVYTDDTGQRLAKVDGKFYKESEVSNSGTLIGTPTPIDTGNVRLATVDASGSVKNGGIILGNVKAGIIDTDAVNVSQLKKMGLDITGGKPVVTYDSTIKNTITLGDTVANAYNPATHTGGVKITNVAEGSAAGDAVNYQQLSAVKAIANSANQGWTLKANGDAGTSILPAGTVEVKDGSNISVTRTGSTLTIATTASPQFGTVKINDASGGTVTGLSNKTFNTTTITSGQGATEDQLKTVFDTLKNNINSTTANSVNYDSATKDQVTLGGASGTGITKLSAGGINSTSSDAVNGSQIYQSLSSVATRLGGAAAVGADGKLTAPSYNISGYNYNTVGDALSALNRHSAVATYVNAAGETVLRGNDGKYYKKLNADGTGDTSTGEVGIVATDVHHALINAAGSTTTASVLGNVAAGKVGAGSTDAINGSQLFSGMTALTSLLGGGAGVNVDGTFKAPSYAIGAAGNTTNYDNVGGALSALNTQAFKPITFTGDAGAGNAVALGGRLAIKGATGGNITTTVDASGVTINTVDSPKFGGVTINAGGSGKITGLSKGTEANDAVNKAQLDAISTAVGNTDALAKKNITISGNTGAATPTTFNLNDKPAFSISGGALASAAASGSNILTETTATGVLIKIVDNPVFKGTVKAAAFEATDGIVGDIKMDGSGHITGLSNKTFDSKNIVSGRVATEDQLSVLAGEIKNATDAAGVNYVAYDPSTGKSKVTLGGLASDGTPAVSGGVTLTNVKNAVADSDAVNLGQIKSSRTNLATILGTTIDNAGTILTPSYTIGGHAYNNVKEAFAAVNRQAGTVGHVNADGVRVYKANDGKFYKVLNADGSGDTTSGDTGIDITSNPKAIHHALVNADGSTTSTSGSVLGNVGAGKIATGSLEAINGGQLYAAKKAIANMLGGKADLDGDGNFVKPSYTIGEKKYDNVGGALNEINNLVSTTNNTLMDGLFSVSANGKDNTKVGKGAVIDLSSSATDKNINVTRNGTNFTFGLAEELNIVKSITVGGTVIKGDEITIDGKKVLTENNIDTIAQVKNAVQYDTDAHDKVTLGGVSRTTPVTLTNVKAGTLSDTSTDAVNGSQLYATNAATAKALGGDAGVNVDGTFKAPSYKVGKGYDNVGDALYDIDGRVKTLEAQNGGMFRVSKGSTTVTDPTPSGENALAGGSGAVASAKNSNALGNGAQATAENSIALGNGSVADRKDTLSVGKAGGERQITHVARGTQNTDAVNVGQVKEMIAGIGAGFDQVNRNISEADHNARSGIAGVAAMANIPQVMKPGQKSIGLGTASYRGEQALSLGVSMSTDDGRWVFKGSASYDSRKHSVVGAGVSYIWE